MNVPIKETIQFISEGGCVTRYHTRPGIKPDTDAHHSHGVAMFCYLLCGGISDVQQREIDLVAYLVPMPCVSSTLLMAALCHDIGEQVASDVSAPSKRLLGIQEQLHELETQQLKLHWLDYEQYLSSDEKRTLKLADNFDGLMYCIREISLGNKNMLLVWRRWSQYLFDMGLRVGIEQDIFNAIQEIYMEATNVAGPQYDCFASTAAGGR